MRDGHHRVAAPKMETFQLHGLEHWRDSSGGAEGGCLHGEVDDSVGEAAGDVGARDAGGGGDGNGDDGARYGLDE